MVKTSVYSPKSASDNMQAFSTTDRAASDDGGSVVINMTESGAWKYPGTPGSPASPGRGRTGEAEWKEKDWRNSQRGSYPQLPDVGCGNPALPPRVPRHVSFDDSHDPFASHPSHSPNAETHSSSVGGPTHEPRRVARGRTIPQLRHVRTRSEDEVPARHNASPFSPFTWFGAAPVSHNVLEEMVEAACSVNKNRAPDAMSPPRAHASSPFHSINTQSNNMAMDGSSHTASPRFRRSSLATNLEQSHRTDLGTPPVVPAATPLDASYRTATSDEEACPLCLCDLDSEPKCTIKPCGHVYHTECMFTCFSKCSITDCPLCRGTIDSLTKDTGETLDATELRRLFIVPSFSVRFRTSPVPVDGLRESFFKRASQVKPLAYTTASNADKEVVRRLKIPTVVLELLDSEGNLQKEHDTAVVQVVHSSADGTIDPDTTTFQNGIAVFNQLTCDYKPNQQRPDLLAIKFMVEAQNCAVHKKSVYAGIRTSPASQSSLRCCMLLVALGFTVVVVATLIAFTG
ncbi:hypothetical protein DIPPA_30655 [Diplonema papillatum]|nr:hypothetical protein DIPPA_30655 [Diplonema papillatum]KAJ9453175.1 hypothetical protein DIPPA_30655 [Diplonema papillatum]